MNTFLKNEICPGRTLNRMRMPDQRSSIVARKSIAFEEGELI
jgi:hypothetical protein